MENNGIIKILEELNLSDKESKVYISLLKLGQSNVTRLAEVSETNRVTTYSILRSLSNKGLITSTTKDKIQNFQALEPGKILNLLKEKQEKIKSIIPELESLRKTAGKKPYVELYEGHKGISSLLDEVLNSSHEIISYGNYTIAEKLIEYESLNFRKKRITKKIKLKSVINELSPNFTNITGWKKLTEVRVNKRLKDISVFVHIFGDKVSILTFEKELMGVVIENKEIAEMHRLFFEMLWEK